MIECTNLTKSYKKKRVVDNLSFSVNNGEIFAFLANTVDYSSVHIYFQYLFCNLISRLSFLP